MVLVALYYDYSNTLFRSPHNPHTYIRGIKQKKVKLFKIKLDEFSPTEVIDKGYHSTILPTSGHGRKIGIFKIPKGTGYYKNKYDYVSETLVYLGRYNDKHFAVKAGAI